MEKLKLQDIGAASMEGGIGDDGQRPPSEQPSSSAQQVETQNKDVQPPRPRVGRKPTRMSKMIMRNPHKMKIIFDNRRLMPCGPEKTNIDNWSSYLGFLGRKEPSILICSWKTVPEPTKELIWQGILEKFNIFIFDGANEVELSQNDLKLQSRFKRKWLTYIGSRWAVFKTNLTTDYIYGQKKDPPYVSDYKYLDKVTWDAFVALKLTPEEKEKRKKAQEVQSCNKCPQRTSRGGYDLLEKKMMDEKIKTRQAASQDSSEIIPPPSPPTRHEKWKRARLNTSGQYINPEVEMIAQKIIRFFRGSTIVRQFQCKWHKRLTCGCNRKARSSKPCTGSRERIYTVSTYFGKQRQPSGMVSREEFNSTREELNSTIAEMEKKLQLVLNSQAFSCHEPISPVVDSVKGSNLSAAPNNRMESELHDEHNDECELYVEDPKRRLVAYGRIHDLGLTVHNMKLNADDVRVTVVRVLVEDAPVPFPTDEVSTVGEAPNNFIVWPRRLIESVGRKGLSQKELFPKPKSQPNTETDSLKRLWIAAVDICQPKHVCIDAGVVSRKTVDVYITQEDVIGLCTSRKISFSVMQLYNKYLSTTLRLSERNDKYGLINPLHGNSDGTLQTRMEEGDFECFLAPIYETNWQLIVLCPKQNYVAWFCFMQNKPSKKISSRIETAFNTYQLMKGIHSRQLNKLKWVYPKCLKRGGSDECGLLVMRHMLEIIKLDIVDSFEKVFNMVAPYSDSDVDVVRRHWAECFMEVLP
ncbi:hypothetical protein CASFOL_007630 [Castilleja foliolosa]|uniref:DUF8039 domain-containing protein n=1 Tax=Castilleja foliolosa TaxID=1961234 RepID=A0ABD3E557_9LAMI